MSLAMFGVMAAKGISVDAQAAQAVSYQPKVMIGKSAHIAVSLAVPQKQIPAGQKPSAILTVELLGGNLTTVFPEDRVHVEGEMGEAPTTLYQRQVTHTLRPGEPGLMSGGFEPTIGPTVSIDGEPTFSSDRTYDLSLFYDLSKPGKYTVYIEVLDVSTPETERGAGLWVRSQTEQFEVEAAAR
jgi:hypothetical protein